MLDNKTLKEAEQRVKRYVQEKIVLSHGKRKDVHFFLTNAKQSLQSAKLLLDVSGSTQLQEATGQLGFNGYLWVVNASYYSMFYVTRALLDNAGVHFTSDHSIHLLTFDSLVYYFYLTGKLEKHLVESFSEAKEEAGELLGKEKADELVSSYFYEKKKRSIFTYETGEVAMHNKAKTSYERAELYFQELKIIINK